MSSSLEEISKLTGYTSLEALKSADRLLLDDRGLTSVPGSIGQLTNLTFLQICHNQLSSLPESIGQLTNLTELRLSDNQLSSLPESIGQLTNLTVLSLYDNPITELPESITRLKKLERLLLIHQGELIVQRAPIGITALPCYSNNSNPYNSKMSFSQALKKLKLYSNHINENLTDISSFIGKWKTCDRINISNNRISTLPDQLSTLTDLCDFNIANNMFAMFPDVLLKMGWLTSLNIAGNSISTLPTALSSFTALSSLDVGSLKISSIPDVLLKMSWLTSLNIAGNSFIELPEGITKLAKLANLEIKDSDGKISIQHAPVNISTLPCYNANTDLKKLTPPAPFLSIRQRLDFTATHNIDGILENKSQQESAPVLVPSKIEATDASEPACKKGILCLLCLKPFLDPCALECGHIFCSTCVIDAIHKSRLHVPFACPTCRKPVLKSIQISEEMKIAAQSVKMEADSVAEMISNPESSVPKCKNSKCKDKATSHCIRCGNFCHKHLESHNDANDDHIEFISEIIPGILPTSSKLLCPVHKGLEIKYYCAECPEKPFKCAECHAVDHKPEERRLHKYIEYRGIDSQKFKDSLTEQLTIIHSKIEDVKSSQSKIDDQRTKFHKSLDEAKMQARQFIEELKTLVNQLETNINMQIDNFEMECKHELDSKYNEFHADEVRLELSNQLLSAAFETFHEIKPTELGNVMRFAREITSLPMKKPELRTMVTTNRLPGDLLSQLKSLNHQLMFGFCPKASSSQDSRPDSTISPMQMKSFIFDQASYQYFGISEEKTEVIAVNKQQKIVQKTPAQLFIDGGLHSLQGISASKDGVLAVADLFANTVTLYDTKTMSAGLVLRDFGSARDCLFNSPCDVAFDSQGRLFVVDSGSKSVIVFDEHFAFSRRVDFANVGSNQTEGIPRMIEIGAEDNVFVYFAGSNSTLEFDKDFNFIQEKPSPVEASSS